jgi:plastocyanin
MRFARLAAFALVASSSLATAQAPATVEVHLSNFKFAPATVVLKRGQPTILRLVNDSGGGHDFTAREFFASATLAPRDRALVADGEVEVPGKQIREIRVTAPRAGTYKLKCSHSFHKALGMSGRIVVR